MPMTSKKRRHFAKICLPTFVNSTSATKITRLSTITTVIAVDTVEVTVVIVVTVVIAVIVAIVATDIMVIVFKVAVAVAVTVVITTVISTRTRLLLPVLVARARPLHPVLPPVARLTTAHSMRSTTGLTPMLPTVDIKTMSPTTNTTKQPPLNSNSSNKRPRPPLLHLPQVRRRLPLLQVQDPLLLLPVGPLVEEVATVRYVPCISFYLCKVTNAASRSLLHQVCSFDAHANVTRYLLRLQRQPT